MAKKKKDNNEDRVLSEIDKEQVDLDIKRKERLNEIAIENVTGLGSDLDKMYDRIESFYKCNVDKGLVVDGEKNAGYIQSKVRRFTTSLVKIAHGEKHQIVSNSRVKKTVSVPDTFNADELRDKLIKEGVIEGSAKFLGMQDLNSLLFGNTKVKIKTKHKPLHVKYPEQFVWNGSEKNASKYAAKSK